MIETSREAAPGGWQSTRRTVLRGGAAMCGVVLAGLSGRSGAQAGPALPSFKGPIPVTAGSRPWGSIMDGGAREALAKHYDCVEEEYFLSGVANVYGPATAPAPGLSPLDYAKQLRALSTLMRPDIPFTTRAIMVRPRDLGRFSGVVHLAPLHNLDGTTYAEKNLMRNGDVWIGLEVNGGTRFGVEERPSGGIANLKNYDAQRYGELDIPAGLPSDWPDLQPGRLGEAFKKLNFGHPDANHEIFRQEISRSYAQAPDIMTKMAEALRSNTPGNPLFGHKVRRVYTAGRSGQSTILAPYIDFHHEAARVRFGRVPFDGYMIRVGAWPAHRPTGSVLVIVLSEAELRNLPSSVVSELADTDDPMFRYYEIPGVGHGLTARPNVSGGIGQVVPKGVQGISDIEGHSDYQPYDHISLPVIWAMFQAMREWVDKGVPMPKAARVVRDSKAPDGIARDRFGNAVGGLRLPWMDEPDARYVGVISEKNPLEGGMIPFGDAQMRQLYGSKQAYQARIDARLNQMARDRWIAAEDIPLMRQRGISPALALGFDGYTGDNRVGLSPAL